MAADERPKGFEGGTSSLWKIKHIPIISAQLFTAFTRSIGPREFGLTHWENFIFYFIVCPDLASTIGIHHPVRPLASSLMETTTGGPAPVASPPPNPEHKGSIYYILIIIICVV